MVDRYFLPIPKSKMYGTYIIGKNAKLKAILHLSASFLISMQIARIQIQRSTHSKPEGYFVDWGSPDAPKKVKFYA